MMTNHRGNPDWPVPPFPRSRCPEANPEATPTPSLVGFAPRRSPLGDRSPNRNNYRDLDISLPGKNILHASMVGDSRCQFNNIDGDDKQQGGTAVLPYFPTEYINPTPQSVCPSIPIASSQFPKPISIHLITSGSNPFE